LQAYEYFRKSNEYVVGYKESTKLMKEAFEKSIINVVINPIEDNNIFYSALNNLGLTGYRPQEYRGIAGTRHWEDVLPSIPARFYTDRDVRRDRMPVDREVDIRWRNIQSPRVNPSQYTRQASKKIEIGKDSAGKAMYQTVYATLNVNQKNYAVRADLEYKITDLNDSRHSSQGLVQDDITWSESSATYTGDSRALSQEDWNGE
jgi:hypothetical protein